MEWLRIKAMRLREKICPACGVSKEIRISLWNMRIRVTKRGVKRLVPDGCRECGRARCRSYRARNLERCRERSRIWARENKDRARENNRAYMSIEGNAERRRARGRKRHSERYRSDVQYRLKISLRTRINQALKRNRRPTSVLRAVGCTISELKSHIEAQFCPGMTWDNWARDGWHVDHIVPLSFFDLSDPEQMRAAAHFSNLRPLWAKDNLSKGAHHG